MTNYPQSKNTYWNLLYSYSTTWYQPHQTWVSVFVRLLKRKRHSHRALALSLKYGESTWGNSHVFILFLLVLGYNPDAARTCLPDGLPVCSNAAVLITSLYPRGCSHLPAFQFQFTTAFRQLKPAVDSTDSLYCYDFHPNTFYLKSFSFFQLLIGGLWRGTNAPRTLVANATEQEIGVTLQYNEWQCMTPSSFYFLQCV